MKDKEIHYAVTTMGAFREAIDGDERMLKFAADHLDAHDDQLVSVIIDGQFVTYELKP